MNPNEPVYDARQLGNGKMLLLGFQHLFAMFGATILVPILVNNYFHGEGLSIQVTLFFAGIGTLIFHLCSRLKVPAFLGSSFAFLGGFDAVSKLDTGIFAGMSYGEKLPYACGGVVVAGLLYLVMALVIRAVGTDRILRFLPPVVTGPIIICIGLGLAPSAITNASSCWPLALIALSVVIIFNIWGKGIFKIIPILMGVLISYGVALLLHAAGMTNADGTPLMDFTSVMQAAPLGLPPFQYAKFDLSAIFVMAPIAIASMMEHVGDISAISATTKRNFFKDPGLQNTMFGDGLATAVSGLFGGPANTTYGENTGVLELSRVFDPRVIRLAALYAILLSFIPKVAQIISTMPIAIVGGISFVLYGMISAIGIRNVVENRVDFTKSRNLIIMAVILVCGLGFTNGITFAIGGFTITLTSLAIASIAGVVLNIILPGNEYRDAGKKNEEGNALKQTAGGRTSMNENVILTDHPLIQHKITRLRDKNTGTAEFRTIVSEIARLMGYEALRDLHTEERPVETPMEKTMSTEIAEHKQAVVPILRAGLGMTDGILSLIPTAKVGHVGMYRDPVTHEPHEYYCKLPEMIEKRTILVLDPMLATGGSAIDTISLIKQKGGKRIKFMCIIAAPEGVEALTKAHPDVQIYIGHIDRQLNQDAYICPGLGDAGDRIFGTK